MPETFVKNVSHAKNAIKTLLCLCTVEYRWKKESFERIQVP